MLYYNSLINNLLHGTNVQVSVDDKSCFSGVISQWKWVVLNDDKIIIFQSRQDYFLYKTCEVLIIEPEIYYLYNYIIKDEDYEKSTLVITDIQNNITISLYLSRQKAFLE